jgi:hypothetical protein
VPAADSNISLSFRRALDSNNNLAPIFLLCLWASAVARRGTGRKIAVAKKLDQRSPTFPLVSARSS